MFHLLLTKALPSSNKEPVKLISPSTSNLDCGLELPIHTLPIISKSFLKMEFTQKSLHTLKQNELETKIIEGPAKGTQINIILETKDRETLILIKIDLKLKSKFIFLTPIIKRMYKKTFTSILYRINTEIQNEIEH